MHNLDITDGQTSFVAAHTDAWHKLGTTLDHSFTAEEAMTEGLLGGWNVRKLPVFALGAHGEQLPMPGRNAVIRDNPVNGGIDVLGDVGDSYQIIQNEDHAALLNALVDESGAHFDTAGALDGGKQVFITMKLPGHISVGGVDPVDNYIAAINSHDGSKAFTLMVTPIRVVCANTMHLAYQDHSHLFRIRHTSGAEKALRGQAREALDMTFNYLDAFQLEANQLIDTTLTQVRFEELIKSAFGPQVDGSVAARTRTENKLDEMAELFGDGATQANVRNTAWAGLNALTEWYDHMSPTRGTDRDSARAQKALMEVTFKNKARQLMLSV